MAGFSITYHGDDRDILEAMLRKCADGGYIIKVDHEAATHTGKVTDLSEQGILCIEETDEHLGTLVAIDTAEIHEIEVY